MEDGSIVIEGNGSCIYTFGAEVRLGLLTAMEQREQRQGI